MNYLLKILGVNLIVLIAYSLIIRGLSTKPYRNLNILMISAVLIILHILVNLIIGRVFYSKGEMEKGRVFMLSAGIVLLIGFSSCWGNASL